MKKIGVFSGAGISAESGLGVFRGSGGLWEGYDIMKVASPEGWKEDPAQVLEFYNLRRKKLLDSEPNAGHFALAELENLSEVVVVTQNIDNLHERAGSTNVVHLHGELLKARSTRDENLVYTLQSYKLELGDRCELGSQLRPHIVWFGEMVPELETAANLLIDVDELIVVGTSLEVYPAASLIHCIPASSTITLIDPNAVEVFTTNPLRIIRAKASIGLPMLVEEIRGSR